MRFASDIWSPHVPDALLFKVLFSILYSCRFHCTNFSIPWYGWPIHSWKFWKLVQSILFWRRSWLHWHQASSSWWIPLWEVLCICRAYNKPTQLFYLYRSSAKAIHNICTMISHRQRNFKFDIWIAIQCTAAMRRLPLFSLRLRIILAMIVTNPTSSILHPFTSTAVLH